MLEDKLSEKEFVLPPLPKKLRIVMLLSLLGNLYWAWATVNFIVSINETYSSVDRAQVYSNPVGWFFYGNEGNLKYLIKEFYRLKYLITAVNIASIFLSVFALSTIHRRIKSGLKIQAASILIPILSSVIFLGLPYFAIPFNTFLVVIEIIFILLYLSCSKYNIYQTFK